MRGTGFRRLTIDIPREIPIGKVILTFTPASVIREKMSEAQENELFRIHSDKLNTEAENMLFYKYSVTI